MSPHTPSIRAAPDPQVVAEVENKARELYEQVLDPIAERFAFEPSPVKAQSGTPLVLLLGNHSSGKSSFINYLTGEKLQRTGIAPIDDGFTILTHGQQAKDRDGAAIVTDPDLPWSDLQRFGPQLTSHLRQRAVPNPKLQGIALVDSPGMIDAADAKVDRGYDFAAVVRWFAERADVILLLFDPDKPGTTGETLQVLTDSLAGMDHKLLLIFNKVDRFTTMRDFARAYGALCWNLSKALARKDLPHVYNTYLPVADHNAGKSIPLGDFNTSIEEVAIEVRRAPFRRLDNIVSHLHEYGRRLRVHATVVAQLRKERLAHRLHAYLVGAGIGLFGSLSMTAAYLWAEQSRWQWLFGLLVLTLAVGAGAYWLYARERRLREESLSFEALFERAFGRELALGDEADDLRALWQSVRDRVKRAATGEVAIPRLRRAEQRDLAHVIEQEVPKLRSRASSVLKQLP